MSEILQSIPNLNPASPGQLKFRVDVINCFTSYDPDRHICNDGDIVDIFIEPDGSIIGYTRNQNMTDFISANLFYGRPKGFGVVLWINGGEMKVMWTPYIGDEGYFE